MRVPRKTITSTAGLKNLLTGGVEYFLTSVGSAQGLTMLTLSAQNTTNPGAGGLSLLYFTKIKKFTSYLEHMRNYPGRAILIPPTSQNYSRIYYQQKGGHADYVCTGELDPDGEEYVIDIKDK